MDAITIGTLAASAVGALVPLFKALGEKAMEKAGEKAGEAVMENRSKVLDVVKGLFLEDDLTTLGDLSKNPEDLKIQGKLEGKLEEKLKTNPDTFNKLDELLKRLEEMEKNQPMSKNVSNIKNENIHNSFIRNDVNQK